MLVTQYCFSQWWVRFTWFLLFLYDTLEYNLQSLRHANRLVHPSSVWDTIWVCAIIKIKLHAHFSQWSNCIVLIINICSFRLQLVFKLWYLKRNTWSCNKFTITHNFLHESQLLSCVRSNFVYHFLLFLYLSVISS